MDVAGAAVDVVTSRSLRGKTFFGVGVGSVAVMELLMILLIASYYFVFMSIIFYILSLMWIFIFKMFKIIDIQN